MGAMKGVIGSVLFFALATLAYLVILFREAGQRNAAIGLSAIASRTVLSPTYWVAFAVVLFIGWKITAWLAH